MPTKPTEPLEFATNNVYTAPDAGPFPGSANKVAPPNYLNGFLPGNPIAAEHANSLWNSDSLWNRWVWGGTDDPDATAHIVETNAGGQANVLLMEIGTAVLGALALHVQNSSNIFEALNVENHDPDGAGAFITAGGTGLTISAGDSGLRCTGGPGSPSASFLKSVGGADRGAIFIEPQSNPNNIVDGDIWKLEGNGPSSANRGALRYSDAAEGGKVLEAHATEKGYFFDHKEDRGEDTTTSDTPTNKLTLQVSVGAGGKYRVTFSASIKVSTGIADKEVGFIFDTGIAGKSRDYQITMPNPDDYMPVSATWVIDGNAAPIDLTIDFYSPDDTTGVRIADAEITIDGAHDIIE
jgi:hypothetical protein